MKLKKSISLYFVFLALSSLCFAQNTRPNVIVIITDDQGYGDLGINGNPHVRTPVIDNFAKKSIQFTNFYVSPVCAPTRASLLTGRYSLRTGIRDTYNGGAMMATEEITLAEMLKKANYKTGIFGKWHLGDNYPFRPSEQGFDESLIHLAGGMGQVGDITTFFKGDSSYFDPVLWHNNRPEAFEGYCSDIFTEQAIDFIEKNSQTPFFCYLSFNAPHTPLQVPDEYYARYKDIDPSEGFGEDGKPFPSMTEQDKEDARKVYAMVENIDDNLGKLFKKLDQLGITENTLIIFMTDNGPQQRRYVGGLRDRKGSVFQGGIRVPFYLSYPAFFAGNREIEEPSAHLDLVPTLAEICNLDLPKDRTIDGRSLLPLLKNPSTTLPERSLFSYWSRGYPELYVNIALQRGDYKLIGNTDYGAPVDKFELFNVYKDPFEETNLIQVEKSKATALKTELDSIYQSLIHSPNLVNQPRIILGHPAENPVILNRNDAAGERGIWNQEEVYGFWRVKIEAGNYNIKFKFIKPVAGNGKMYMETNTLLKQVRNSVDNTDLIELKNVYFGEMETDFRPFYQVGNRTIFPFWAEFEKIN
jgi:arylsulfatase